MKKTLISLLLMVASVSSAFAIPAQPGIWRTYKLASGGTLEVQLKGDEFMSFWQDRAGRNYTLTENGLVSANMNQLQQRSRELRASFDGPYLAKDGIRRANARTNRPKKVSYMGKKRCLILLVQFANKKFSMDDPQAFYQRVANEEGFSEGRFRGSVRDYFLAQSNGKFELDFDVVGPYTLANYEVYGRQTDTDNDVNACGMIAAACQNAANEGVDFSPYDWDDDGEVEMVFVVYAGRGQASGGDENTIWPHKWALASPTRYGNKYVSVYACSNEMQSDTQVDGIGTICHEFSHCLGYPDLYDTSYNGFYGMGTWDLMCSGSYNGNSFCPAGYTAYEKWAAGWIDPIELKENIEVKDMATVAKGGNAYKFTNPNCEDEYYIIENRQQEGWDAATAASGIFINHVNYDAYLWDFNMPNTNNATYNTFEHVTLIPADNMKTDATEKGDTWPNGNRTVLNNTSSPADICMNPNVDGKNFMNISISNMEIADDQTASFKFTNYNLSSSQEGYLLHETFDKCQGTGGNEGGFVPPLLGNTFASGAFVPDVEGWQSNYMRSGTQCGRFGRKGETSVVLTAPEIELDGEARLTFKCAPLGRDNATLTLVADHATLDPMTVNMTHEQWNEVSATIKGTGKTLISFSSTAPFFLDEVYVQSTTSGIDLVKGGLNMSSDAPLVFVYNLQGQEIYRCKTSEFDTNQLPVHGIFVIKQGKLTRKIIK